MGEYDRYRRALAGRRLPCAFVDLDRFDANAAALVRRASGLPIRVVSKSLRCLTLLRRVTSRPGFRGVMAYNPGEAAWLHEQGVDDILVAYPSVERHDLEALCQRVALHGATIRLMVDDPVQVAVLSQIAVRFAQREGVACELELCIDLDLSTTLPGLHLGVRRSPLRELDALLELAELIADSEGLGLVGLLGYEAQLTLPDALPGQRARNLGLRAATRSLTPLIHGRRSEALEALRAEGFELELVNGGGTGCLEAAAADPSLTELAAGSGLFAPTLFDHYRGFAHHPAAGFALPIVRRPSATIFTCAGGGYVASGPAGDDRLPRPWLPAGGELLALEGAGEVQTPVRFGERQALEIGDPILFRHAKAGELCEHFATLLLLREGEVVDEVPSYRGEGRCWQ